MGSNSRISVCTPVGPTRKSEPAGTLTAYYAHAPTCLLALACGILLVLGKPASILSLLLGRWVVIGACKALAPWNTLKLNIRTLSLLCYSLLCVVGLLHVCVYRFTYDSDFGPYGDDSRYFEKMLALVNGYEYESPLSYIFTVTPYQYVLAAVYLGLSLVGKPELLDLLPINWAAGAICVGLSYLLACQLTGRRCSAALTVAALMGSAVFVDSVVHLYRDGLMCVAFLACLLAAVRRRYVLALVLAVAAGAMRGANGFVALIAVVFLVISNAHVTKRARVLAVVAAAGAFGVTLVLFQDLLLSRTTSMLFETAKQEYAVRPLSVREVIEGRREELFLSRQKTGGVYDIMYRSPWSVVIGPVMQMFYPVTFDDAVHTEEVHIEGWRLFTVRMLRPYSVLRWVNILLLIKLGPMTLIGIYRGLRGPLVRKVIVCTFLTLVAGVSFVSFQDRHACMFIVLLPALLGFAEEARSTRAERVLGGCFLGVIFLFNIRRLLIS